MNTDTVAAVTSTEPDITPFRCPKCPKSFISQAGLNMHNMRVHTKQILARGQKGFKANPKARARKANYPSSDLATRRAKYRQTRDHYRALGLDAKGRPFKTAWGRKVSERMSRMSEEAREKLRWTPERKAKFSRTMRKIAARKAAMRYTHGFEAPVTPKAKRIQFVYPTPETNAESEIKKLRAMTVPTEHADKPTNIRRVRYCPFCGELIERHLYETP